MVAVHRCGQLYIHMNCRRCTASCLGAHNRKNAVNIYNAREYGIYIVMKNSCLITIYTLGPIVGRSIRAYLAPVPERPISANPGLKILFQFCIYLNSYALLRATFCAIITESRSKGTTVFYLFGLRVQHKFSLSTKIIRCFASLYNYYYTQTSCCASITFEKWRI